MKKQHKKSLALTKETVRTLGHFAFQHVVAGFNVGTHDDQYGNSCTGGCGDTAGDGGGGHKQM